jgi:hypothetical protein
LNKLTFTYEGAIEVKDKIFGAKTDESTENIQH